MQINPWLEAAINLFYPSICQGCQAEAVDPHQMICADCLQSLPYTGFERIEENPIQQLFWGRTRISFACSVFYYIEQSPIQEIIHQIKYKDNKKLALRMGEVMGEKMTVPGSHLIPPLPDTAGAYCSRDQSLTLIPMPMHPKKLRQRGYNQATLLCQGIAQTTGFPLAENWVIKTRETATQTKKSRTERWQNVASVFSIPNPMVVASKDIILVDDVVTTGASAEAVANTLLEHGAASVRLYTLAFTL